MRHPGLIGKNNYQVKRLIAKHGDYVPANNHWRMKAHGILSRCRKFGIKTDFEDSLELALYIRDIAPEKCPVFNKKLVKGNGKPHKFSPSVDRIDPAKGYIKGNLQVISLFANYMKQEATRHQLVRFSQWIIGGKNASVC